MSGGLWPIHPFTDGPFTMSYGLKITREGEGRRGKENKARVSHGPFLFRFIGTQRVKDKDLTPNPPSKTISSLPSLSTLYANVPNFVHAFNHNDSVLQVYRCFFRASLSLSNPWLDNNIHKARFASTSNPTVLSSRTKIIRHAPCSSSGT